jgi:hypothetical protein
MSFLKSLFGGGKSAESMGASKAAAEESYKDFIIKATPMSAGGEHQICGVIEKVIDGEQKSYRFVRADRVSSLDQAASLTISKGRQIIDEQGEHIFS